MGYFAAAIILVLLAAAAIINWTDGWAGFGRYVSGLDVTGFVAAVVGISLLIVVAGYGTIRRITV